MCAAIALQGSAARANERIDYATQVKPVLAERCYACHGALKQEGDLRLDTAALAAKGGVNGAAFMRGDADASLLIQRVTARDEAERMPAEGQPLKPEQIAVLRRWIAQNAPAPADEQPEQKPGDHWAYRPIVSRPPPKAANARWPRNAVDAFIAQQHEQYGIAPQPEAPREVLVRRLYLDLIGLPPSEDELLQAQAAQSEAWYELLVERLLNDPRHGERWGRHWMDIWRYSDWWGLGEQLRNSQPHIWHWRDWIVESINVNTPYDEMLRLMLAADELHPNNLDKLRATGFLARNWALFGRDLWMDETVEHVCKGFLGLTMNCAKCHDHKFDPIEQVDYYRMRAVFEPYHVRLDMVPGEPDFTRDAIPRIFDGLLDAPTFRYERGQESQPDKTQVITPGVPKMLAFSEFIIQPVSLPKEAWQPERRPWVLETYARAVQEHVTKAEAAAVSARDAFAAISAQQKPGELPSAVQPANEAANPAVADANDKLNIAELAVEAARTELVSVNSRAAATRAAWAGEGKAGEAGVVKDAEALAAAAIEAERQAALTKARHAIAGIEVRLRRSAPEARSGVEMEMAAAREALAKAEQIAAAPVTSADQFTPIAGAKWTPTRFGSSLQDDPTIEFPPQSTGRRTALAAWITDPRNPLTARVAVNHIWARHMSAPLVATVFDFGRKGSPPTHPELLDWLAAELIDSGWDMKHLHRLIVTSSAYRMSSSVGGADSNLANDPDNLRFWRREPHRLEAEVVRDSILSLAGTLDLARGGPPVPPAAQADSTRRSLYFFHSNNERNPFLTAFDEAGVKECYRRDQSIIPQQALALSNSRLVHDASRKIAERLSQSPNGTNIPPDDEQFIRRAFQLILMTQPSDDEVSASARALKAWSELPAESADHSSNDARRHLVWALLNHNDFVTVR